jgi:Ohr subfamily peroxiredoxin
MGEKIDLGASEVSASVGIGMGEVGFGLAVELDIHIPDLPAEQAQDLVEKAHQACPYSNATRGNVEVTLRLV